MRGGGPRAPREATVRHVRQSRKAIWLAAALATLVGGTPAAAGQAAAANGGLTDADRPLLRACSSALTARAFDEATAAGLKPGAVPVSIAFDRATRVRDGNALVYSGVEDYRPTPSTGALPVRYDCRIDAATARVESITYAVVDDTGAPFTAAPAQVVRDVMALDACSRRIESRMNDDSRRRGDTANDAEFQIPYRGVAIARSAGLTDFRGEATGRYGPAYDWQTSTFTCRFEEKRAAATRSSHNLGPVLEVRMLTPEALAALGACRASIEQQVHDAAVERGYPLWELRDFRVRFPELATVTPQATTQEVTGRAEYKLDERHNQPTHMSYACRYDTAARRLTEARYTLDNRGRTPSGAISTGVTDTLRCEAWFGQTRCPASIAGDVRILRQLRGTECVERRNWMWSPQGVLVWDGCRAEFEYRVR